MPEEPKNVDMTDKCESLDGLFIASEVRSGSTFVAESLAYSLHASYGVECWQLAEEHFTPLQEGLNGSSAREILDSLFLNQFGFKCGKWMVNDLKYLFRSLSFGNVEDEQLLSNRFAWIIVLRRDTVRQAISSAYAKSSGVYHHYTCANIAGDEDVAIQYEDVRLAFREILTSKHYLETLSGRLKRACIIYYEDYKENPRQELSRIIRDLRLPFDLRELQLSPPKLVPTAQEAKAVWRCKFDDLFLSFP